MIGLLLVVLAIAAVVAWRLHPDLRRAQVRRLLREAVAEINRELTEALAREEAAEKARREAEARRAAWWASLTPEERFEHHRRSIMFEERIAMSIMRPTDFKIITSIVP